MIKYRLNCNDCNMSFDSWFASSKEFERLKKKKLLSCHNCNSSKIEKTIMSPRLINKSNEKQDLKFKKINKKIQEYQSNEYKPNEIFKFSDALVDSLTSMIDREYKKKLN